MLIKEKLQRNIIKSAVALLGVLFLAGSLSGKAAAAVRTSPNYGILSEVLSGGGNTSTSASYTTQATIGQPGTLGIITSASFTLHSGSQAINDADGDGIPAKDDNCPGMYNPAQKDTNGDGVGDACNKTPVAVDGVETIDEDNSFVASLVATDADNNPVNPLTYSIVTAPSKGAVEITNTATGEYKYTPRDDENGEDFFTFKVNDETVDSNTATISILIAPINDAPKALGRDEKVYRNRDNSLSLSANDVDRDSLLYTIIERPKNGDIDLNVNTGTYTYTVNSNEEKDAFTFKVSDGEFESGIATVNISISRGDTLDVGANPAYYASIQTAIDNAKNGDIVLVHDKGEPYRENINFKGRAILLTSPEGSLPEIKSPSDGTSVVTFNSGESMSSILEGFRITNGKGTIIATGDNAGRKAGGGIYCESSSPTIRKCVISDNSINTDVHFGAGIYCKNAYPSISNCIISNNNALTNGGGIYYENSGQISKITNCLIFKNKSTNGGGIYSDSSTVDILNCTISMNHAINNGRGVFFSQESVLTIYNSIIWGNTGGELSTGEIYPFDTTSGIKGRYSDVFLPNGLKLSGEGNINKAPLFVDDDNGNFNLQFISPCIDTGRYFVAPKLDIGGISRPQGDANDMGAHEFFPTTITSNIPENDNEEWSGKQKTTRLWPICTTVFRQMKIGFLAMLCG